MPSHCSLQQEDIILYGHWITGAFLAKTNNCLCCYKEPQSNNPHHYPPGQWTSWFKGRTSFSWRIGRDPLWWQSGILQTCRKKETASSLQSLLLPSVLHARSYWQKLALLLRDKMLLPRWNSAWGRARGRQAALVLTGLCHQEQRGCASQPCVRSKSLKTLTVLQTCFLPQRGRRKPCYISQGAWQRIWRGFWDWGRRGWQTAGDERWPGPAVSSVNKLGSGGEVVRYIFLIIELCTHYETITEPKYIKFQITNTSLYKGVIK